jgi:hypothetical protein
MSDCPYKETKANTIKDKGSKSQGKRIEEAIV